MSVEKPTFAIVTCSDTRSMKQDTAGAALEALGVLEPRCGEG